MVEVAGHGERERRLAVVDAELVRLDAVQRDLTRAVVAADAVGAWGVAGALSGRAYLGAYGGVTGLDASRWMRLARLLDRFEVTGQAVADGEVSMAKAAVLAAVVTPERAGYYSEGEATLLEAATKLSTREFEVLVGHWVALVDQEVAAPGVGVGQRLYVQGRLGGGSDIAGCLDEPTTMVLLAGLDAFDTGPDRSDCPGGSRTLARRRADSLGDLAQYALAALDHDPTVANDSDSGGETRNDDGRGHGEADGHAPQAEVSTPGPARSRALVVGVVDLPTVLGRDPSDLVGMVCEIDGRSLSPAALEQLLCTSRFQALVTGARASLVAATDASNLFTDTQRHLIAARDRHCIFPGCGRPPSLCDVHHLRARHRGGGRDPANGVLLCRRHHTLIHRGWALTRDPTGGWEATDARGRVWAGRPPPGPPMTSTGDPDPPGTATAA